MGLTRDPALKRWATKKLSQLIEHQFIDIAPAPIFARLKRPDDRVIGCVEVFGRVFIL